MSLLAAWKPFITVVAILGISTILAILVVPSPTFAKKHHDSTIPGLKTEDINKAFIESATPFEYGTLDQCTPYAQHINDRYINPAGEVLGPCAQQLGTMKHNCETFFVSGRPGPWCSDPRYTNWLLNDYSKYPSGTWDYPDPINGTIVHP